MSEIIRIEHRTCPFCKHEYMRNVYATDRGRGTICPKCRKRSDRSHSSPGRYKSPVLTKCKLPECNNMFYKLGPQNYCSPECEYEAHLQYNYKRNKKFFKEHPEKRKEYALTYYNKHKEQIAKKAKKYREEHGEEVRKYHRDRYKRLKEQNKVKK